VEDPQELSNPFWKKLAARERRELMPSPRKTLAELAGRRSPKVDPEMVVSKRNLPALTKGGKL